MANIKSNEKRHNQDEKKRKLRHSQKSAMKTQIKKTKISCDKADLDKSYKMIDSAVSKNIIKKNKADRLKSRLALHVNKNSK